MSEINVVRKPEVCFGQTTSSKLEKMPKCLESKKLWFISKIIKYGGLSISEHRDRVQISSTFSVLRPLYFDRFTSTRLLRPLYFDFLSELDFLLVEKHRSKYSFGRSKVGVSKYRKGRTGAYPRDTSHADSNRTSQMLKFGTCDDGVYTNDGVLEVVYYTS